MTKFTSSLVDALEAMLTREAEHMAACGASDHEIAAHIRTRSKAIRECLRRNRRRLSCFAAGHDLH